MDLLASTALSLGLLALIFGPLERAFPARRGQPTLRPELAIDLAFFLGQYLAFAGLALILLGGAAGLLEPLIPGPLRAASEATPLLLRGLLALAIGDVLVYWFHRACHQVPLLWRFHAVHHSAEHLDWLAAHREHPVDGLLTQLVINVPAIALGLPFEAVGGLVVLRGLWAIFIHSNVRLPLGPLRVLLGAPELHHWHHARVAETRHNFANLAPWVDLVFGTYHCPRDPERYPLGLTDPWPRGYLAQLLWPLGLRLGRARAPSPERAPAPPG
ncbi:MAG: sterol desaturase family protein [Myxococcales bacterium]|nr:sterol desaturase family protein [Myxococcales bacterium]